MTKRPSINVDCLKSPHMLGLVLFLRVQNLHRINQRKGHYFIQAQSADKDDKDDEYDSGIFTDRNAQNLRRIKQRKGFCFFQTSSDNKNHQDDGRITPYTFQDFRTEVQLPQQNTPC